MTYEEAVDRVAYIKLIAADDDEAAHKEEDRLYSDFIQDVANQKFSDPNVELVEIAKLILTTKDMDFERWFA